MAHAGPTDLDQDLSRAWRGLRNIRDLSGPTNAGESYSAHDPASFCTPERDSQYRIRALTNEPFCRRSEDHSSIGFRRTEDDQIDLTLTNEVQYFVGWFRMVTHEFPNATCVYLVRQVFDLF